MLAQNWYPAGNYMFKVNNRNTRARYEICSKLTIKTPERRSGVFIVNFEHISHLVPVFLLLTGKSKLGYTKDKKMIRYTACKQMFQVNNKNTKLRPKYYQS